MTLIDNQEQHVTDRDHLIVEAAARSKALGRLALECYDRYSDLLDAELEVQPMPVAVMRAREQLATEYSGFFANLLRECLAGER